MSAERDSNTDSSFLDMITNCVGILIILVMVVGQRAKEAPALMATQRLNDETEKARSEHAAAEQELDSLEAQLAKVEGELLARTAERDQVNTLIAAVEREMAERRNELGAKSQSQYDIARDLALANNELARLEAEREQAKKTVVPQTITIENFPTPLGKTVDGKEAHFQLKGGRVVFVPLDALVERLKSTLMDHARRLESPSDMVDTLEPIGGFRMRYALEQVDSPAGRSIGVSHVELLPVSSQLGEPADTALAPRSKFRDRLEMMSPRQYTITIWTYPDSFDQYRQLKKELYRLGYSVAARPLPEGMPIAASPYGSKSSAQ